MKLQVILKIVIVSALIAFNLVNIRQVKTQSKQNSLLGCTVVYSFPVEGNLSSEDYSSQINVRAEPNLSAKAVYSGHSGDPVTITQVFKNSEDGYCWYGVSFQSKITGWVRGDFVNIFLDHH